MAFDCICVNHFEKNVIFDFCLFLNVDGTAPTVSPPTNGL